MSEKSSSGGGIGLGTALLLIFVTLKLCNVIHWSWWWVLSPLWIGIAFWILMLIAIFIYGYVTVLKKRKKQDQWKKDNPGLTYSKWNERLEEMRKQQQNKING